MVTPMQAALMRCKASQDLSYLNNPEPLSKDSLNFLARAKEGFLEKIGRIAGSFFAFCSRAMRAVPSLVSRGCLWVGSKFRLCSPKKCSQKKRPISSPPSTPKESFRATVAENYPCSKERLDQIVSKTEECYLEGYTMTDFNIKGPDERQVSMIFQKPGSEVLVIV